MKFLVLAILFLLGGAVDALADSLGCFNGSDTVHILAQFTNSSGVATSPTTPTAKIFSPTDTTTASFTPPLAEIDAAGSPGLTRGSFSLGASPTAGTWTVQYKGSVAGNVLAGIDVFQVPCPQMAVKVGGIPAGASGSDGTLSTISATTLTLSSDIISSANQFAYQARIEVVNPTTYFLKGVSCVIASTTAAGPADTVSTAEDISALIAVSDGFFLIPDPTCRNLRPTTAGSALDVAATGEAGLDFANIKQAAGPTTLTNITVPTVTAVTNPVTVGGYAAGQDPATYLLVTPANKIATNASNQVVASSVAGAVGSVTGNVGGNVVGSVASVTNPVTVGTNNDKTGYALTSADKLAVLTAASGTADSGTTSTIVDAERTEAAADYWKDSCVLMTSGANLNQLRRISAFNATSDTLTVDPVFTSAVGTDTYILLRSATCTAANVAGNVTVGGYAAGQDPATYLLVTPANKIATNASNQVVASSVAGNVNLNFGQTLPASPTIDTVGEAMKFGSQRLDAAISSRLATTAFDVKIPTALTYTGGVPNVNTAALEGISLSAKAGDNFNLFFQNGGLDTVKTVDLVGTGAGGGGALDMTQAVPGSPVSGSVGQALRFVLDRLDLNLSTRASQASLDLKIATPLSFTSSYLNAHVKGMDPNTITPAVLDEPEATVITAAAGCNGGVNSASVFSTNLTQAQANFFRSVHLITFRTGALKHSSAQITGYTFTGSAGCLTVTPAFPVAPSIGDTLVIINK